MGAAPLGFPRQGHLSAIGLAPLLPLPEIRTGGRERAIHQSGESRGLFVPLFPHVKKNEWILGHVFQSSYWAYAQLTNRV